MPPSPKFQDLPTALLKVQEVDKLDVKTRNVLNFSDSIYAIVVVFFSRLFQKRYKVTPPTPPII